MNTSSVWKSFSRWYTPEKKTYRATGVYKNYLLVCWSIIYLRCRIMFFDLLCRLLFNLRIVIIKQVLWFFFVVFRLSSSCVLWCPTHILSVFSFLLFVFILCLVCPMLTVSLDCPFLIAPSVSLRFIYWKMDFRYSYCSVIYIE